MIAPYISIIVGAVLAMLAAVYFFARIDAMRVGKWRLDYIVFNASIGVLCVWASFSIIFMGQRAALPHWSVLVLTVSHLCLSYRPGCGPSPRQAFPPDPAMRTDYTHLDEAPWI